MFSNILVAVDSSEPAAHAFETALQLACQTGAQLHPLYVIALPPIAANVPGADPSIMRQMLERQGETVMKHCVGTMARCGAQGSPELDDLARPGDDVADRIVVAATRLNVDLIVMGTRGRPGVGHARVGSIAERVLRRAACPVLTIPSHWSVADREALPRANDAAKPRAQAVFARTSQTVSH